ncbi:OsmC family protein [Pedobacter nutrimenti]|jgi:putative redox protein|uniref:Putative redox protein n=1 Tax=Pedobacter nutrimenti TaxID=1241337 RepID=A0A318UIG0_9SPHI|nr:OsmC family protein [Pedobacter nutrimenti]PYF72874.1 putative redox protein [Pedobacter nutrimenti]
MREKQITAVTELDKSHYKTKVFSGGHLIYADEPADLGGTDEGMPPAALLLASLGSCTAITIRMYADRKQYSLEAIKIELAICSEDQIDKSTTISRQIEFTGSLSQEERQRLLQIADKCPIHKILTNPIKIETVMKA